MATEQWREGVLTRMLVSAATGAAELCIFEQFCDPGCGAPIQHARGHACHHIAPGTVDVRASLKGGLLSITSQPFQFFLVTDAKNCFAFGPGLLKGQPVKVSKTLTERKAEVKED
jgi:hypothetical protein